MKSILLCILCALCGFVALGQTYPANPQKPITYLNRGRSTQVGGIIMFDDPVEFNGGIIGISGTDILTGTGEFGAGPIYIDEPNFRVAVGQPNFLNWNGNAELSANADLAAGDVNALMAHTQGSEGIPIVAWSQSGAPAFLVTQDTVFTNPAYVIYRSGTVGCPIATNAAMLVQTGAETSSTTPVLQAGGCLALSGDNWFIYWGDGGLSFPGGILDLGGTTHGHVSIDPIHRALMAEDGVTQIVTWSGSSAKFLGNVISTQVSVPGTSQASGAPGQFATDGTNFYWYSVTSSTSQWLRSAGSTF